MTTQISQESSLMKVANSTLVSMPAPLALSSVWNFGSVLGLCLVTQVVSGLLLATTYSPSMELSFASVVGSMENPSGWLARSVHSNGASLFFVFMYLHIGRGLYYGSYLLTSTWVVGVTLLLATMATAFLGYVLPVNQMSYWGASVITNLFSEVPYIGPLLVEFIWGGATVSSPTIVRFYAFHFALPFVIMALVVVHITLLHGTGSSNSLGLVSGKSKATFHPYFSYNDVAGIFVVVAAFAAVCLYTPIFLGDNENFAEVDLVVTPHHIQPEWYFLFAYAILRSVPNKFGGVIALVSAVVVLYAVPSLHAGLKKSLIFYPAGKSLFWGFVVLVSLLTWIGVRPVEAPFVLTGQVLSFMYFSYFLTAPVLSLAWDKALE